MAKKTHCDVPGCDSVTEFPASGWWTAEPIIGNKSYDICPDHNTALVQLLGIPG
jgi:hypothetical protein